MKDILLISSLFYINLDLFFFKNINSELRRVFLNLTKNEKAAPAEVNYRL